MRTYLTACRDWQLPVLLASMRRYCQPFHLCVLAWDFVPEPQADVSVMTGARFLTEHPAYTHLPGPPRETINMIDAARWRVIADLLDAEMGPVIYVDGDQWFFSSPRALFEEVRDARVAVSPHRIPAPEEKLPGVTLATHRQYGLYNSGFVYVDELDFAEEMAEAVFQWSYSNVVELPDGSRLFGDQGALERIALRRKVHVIQHPGVNVAPWNANRHRLEGRDGRPHVDGVPLVNYHFSSLRWNPDGSFRQYADANYCVPTSYVNLVYAPYIAARWRLR